MCRLGGRATEAPKAVRAPRNMLFMLHTVRYTSQYPSQYERLCRHWIRLSVPLRLVGALPQWRLRSVFRYGTQVHMRESLLIRFLRTPTSRFVLVCVGCVLSV